MKHIIYCILCFLLPMASHSQIILRGIFLDAQSKQPVSNVNIQVLGSNHRGMIASQDGRFTMQVDEDFELLCSHIAYQSMIISSKNMSKSEEEVIYYLAPVIYSLNDIQINHQDYLDILKNYIKNFDKTFRTKYAMSSGFLTNTASYKGEVLAFSESAGFIYCASKRNEAKKMLFLPFETRASDVVYGDNQELKDKIGLQPKNNFSSFSNWVSLVDKEGPLSYQSFNNYVFVYEPQLSQDNQLIYSFKSKKKAKQQFLGTIQLDSKNNIINWVKIKSNCPRKPINNSDTLVNQLEIYYQYKDNQLYYEKIVGRIASCSYINQELFNDLELSFCKDVAELEKPLYKNLSPQWASSFQLYGSSLVRIYYNEDFWKFIGREEVPQQVVEHLSKHTPITMQFKQNNLKYEPELDFVFSAFYVQYTKEHPYRFKIENEVKEYSDYLFLYEAADKEIRPAIEKLYNDNSELWKE